MLNFIVLIIFLKFFIYLIIILLNKIFFQSIFENNKIIFYNFLFIKYTFLKGFTFLNL
jgi:hypothetical protein